MTTCHYIDHFNNCWFNLLSIVNVVSEIDLSHRQSRFSKYIESIRMEHLFKV